FHTSYEGGILEDPWAEPPEGIYTQTVSPEKTPDRALYLEIEYKAGDPVAINGKRFAPPRLLEKLNTLGAAHGIGRADLVENRYVGMKSRGVYETPGGTILHVAHRAIESITLDREVMHLRDSLIPRYAELVYYGYWFSPERRMLQAAIDEAQTEVEGISRLKLFKGLCTVVGRKAKHSLYIPDLATFEEDRVYRQQDAEGFIRLNALRLKLQALRNKKPR
ncbi:MAG: argininosuccinate synthase, partial [Nitrospira sp.]|nr:argininosuccinate synthase [Nitrospira sp.]